MDRLPRLLRLISAFAVVALAACASGFERFYQALPDYQASKFESFSGTPRLVGAVDGDFQKTILQMYQNGYAPIGTASFNGPAEDPQKAVAQARKIGAAFVVVSSQYQSTRSGVLPLTLPNTTTSYSSGTFSGYGTGGYASGMYSGTTTTYGSQTTYIPYSVDRYDYSAMFFSPLRSEGFGAFFRPLTPEQRQQAGSNQGMHIVAVRNNSPAFEADVLPDDVVLSFDGQSISDIASTQRAIERSAGRPVDIVLMRSGEQITKTVLIPVGVWSSVAGVSGPSANPNTVVRTTASAVNSEPISGQSKAFPPVVNQPGAMASLPMDDLSTASGSEAYNQGDYATALKHFTPLASRGNVTAQFNLGVMYAQGQGVPQNYVEAIKWYRLAAEQKDADALNNLGAMHMDGRGVPQSNVRAHMWFNLASSVPSSDNGATARANRDSLAARMTRLEIAQAQELLRLCQRDNFKRCDEKTIPQAPVAALPSVNAAAPASTARPETINRRVIPLEKEGGTYTVPVQVNGVLTLNFTVDSGASVVTIPADVALTLMRTGTISGADFLEKRTYVLADGSELPSQTLRIRSLKVGDIVIDNVTASVAPVKGSLLLGQSFLGKLKSWSMDNERHVLIIE